MREGRSKKKKEKGRLRPWALKEEEASGIRSTPKHRSSGAVNCRRGRGWKGNVFRHAIDLVAGDESIFFYPF